MFRSNPQPHLPFDSGEQSLEFIISCSDIQRDFYTRQVVDVAAQSYLSVQAIAQEFEGFLQEQDPFLRIEKEQTMAEVFNFYCNEVQQCIEEARDLIRATAHALRERGLIIESVNLECATSGLGQIEHAFTLLINAEAKRWLYNEPKAALAHYRLAERILISQLNDNEPLLSRIDEEMHRCGAIKERVDLEPQSNLSRLLW